MWCMVILVADHPSQSFGLLTPHIEMSVGSYVSLVVNANGKVSIADNNHLTR